MNTNVGEMPLEIFIDYISEQLNMDFSIEFILSISAIDGYSNTFGNGYVFGNDNAVGSSYLYVYLFQEGYGIMTLYHNVSNDEAICGGRNKSSNGLMYGYFSAGKTLGCGNNKRHTKGCS